MGPLRNLPQRFFAGGVTDVELRRQHRGNLLQECRLSDPRVAPQQDDRPRHQSTA